MKNKGGIHIHHFGNRMFMPKVFCHLNRRIFHACFLKLMLVHTAEENVLIVEAVLVLFPFQIDFPGKCKEPFAAQGDAVSHPAQVSINIMIAVLCSRLRHRPGGTDIVIIKELIPPFFGMNHESVIVD